MASVVTSLVSTYLRLLLKDYNKQQLNFHLRSGECNLTNIRSSRHNPTVHHTAMRPLTCRVPNRTG